MEMVDFCQNEENIIRVGKKEKKRLEQIMFFLVILAIVIYFALGFTLGYFCAVCVLGSL